MDEVTLNPRGPMPGAFEPPTVICRGCRFHQGVWLVEYARPRSWWEGWHRGRPRSRKRMRRRVAPGEPVQVAYMGRNP